jgi:uncharacterized protein YicC (UPF0701 family)
MEAMFADFSTALGELAAARRSEGAKMMALVEKHLTAIEALTAAAAESAAAQPDHLRARLKTQVEELIESSPALSEERLMQELALLICCGKAGQLGGGWTSSVRSSIARPIRSAPRPRTSI